MSNKLSKKRKPNAPTYLLARQNQKPRTSKEQATNILMDVRSQAIQQATSYSTEMFLSAFAIVLHKEYKFGTKRVAKTLKAVEDLVNMSANGEMTLEDMLKQVHDELGIHITPNKE